MILRHNQSPISWIQKSDLSQAILGTSKTIAGNLSISFKLSLNFLFRVKRGHARSHEAVSRVLAKFGAQIGCEVKYHNGWIQT